MAMALAHCTAECVIFDRKLSAKFMDELNCRDLKLTSCNVT